MKYTIVYTALFCLAITASSNTFAFPEIPFCPAGGPPGWANHFNYKRDQNNWRQQYYQRPPAAYSPYYTPRLNHYNYWRPPAYYHNSNTSQRPKVNPATRFSPPNR